MAEGRAKLDAPDTQRVLIALTAIIGSGLAVGALSTRHA
jgi:hypothetical protein